MKLTDLEPEFMRYETRVETSEEIVGDYSTWEERGRPCQTVTGPREFIIPQTSLKDAQGMFMACPLCYSKKGNTLVGVHHVEVTFKDCGVKDHQGCHNAQGKPVRWEVSGNSFDNLTLTPSILLQGGCGWHGFVTQGLVSII